MSGFTDVKEHTDHLAVLETRIIVKHKETLFYDNVVGVNCLSKEDQGKFFFLARKISVQRSSRRKRFC